MYICIYICVCVCALDMRNKISTLDSDFPENFLQIYLQKLP